MSDEYSGEQGQQYPHAYQGGGYENYTTPYQDAYEPPRHPGDPAAQAAPGEAGADGFAPGEGVWQPLGQNGEFDAEATMSTQFVQHLDQGHPRPGTDPLAAPGHGYVPQGPPGEGYPQHGYDQGGFAQQHTPPAGTDWHPAAEPVAQPEEQAAAEQWSVPFAPEDPAEESGEYSVGVSLNPPGGHPQDYAPGEGAGPYDGGYGGEATGTYQVLPDPGGYGGPYPGGDDTGYGGPHYAGGHPPYDDAGGLSPAPAGDAPYAGEATGTYPLPGDPAGYASDGGGTPHGGQHGYPGGPDGDTAFAPEPVAPADHPGRPTGHEPHAHHPGGPRPDPLTDPLTDPLEEPQAGHERHPVGPRPDPLTDPLTDPLGEPHPGDRHAGHPQAEPPYPDPLTDPLTDPLGDPHAGASRAPVEEPHRTGPAPGTFGGPDDTLGVGLDLAAAATFTPVRSPQPETPAGPPDGPAHGETDAPAPGETDARPRRDAPPR